MQREKGRVKTMRKSEKRVIKWAQIPGPSSHTETSKDAILN
jgi:hypothetical protein